MNADRRSTPTTRIVRAEAGANWGQFDAATQRARARWSPAGACSTHRRRRARARQRQRLARAQVRLHVRLARRREVVTGRRRRRHRQRGRERRPLLGHARRQRQLRHRHALRVPRASESRRCSTRGMLMYPHEMARDVARRTTATSSPARPTRSAARRRSSARRRRSSCPSPSAASPCSASSSAYAGDPAEGREIARAARRLRPAGGRDGRRDAVRRACSGCSSRAAPDGHAELLDRRLLRELPGRGDRRRSSTARRACRRRSTQVIIVPGGGAVRRVPELGDGVRQPRRAVEHPLPQHVARPGGRRAATSRGRASCRAR